jgi:integrase
LEFLLELYNTGIGYSSINSARSALSLYLSPIEGHSVGTHPIVTRFVKGIGRLKPSFPRYDEIWNVDMLLKYFMDIPTNNNLSLQVLTFKLVALLAITTAQRVQTLNAISVNNISFDNNIMYIKITKMLKTTKPGVKQPVYKFPAHHNYKLCVQNTIVTYLERTLEFRNHDDLFLSLQRPHNPVSNSTLSRWLKEGLKLVGIDVEKYKAHSYRSASTSKAFTKGVNIDDIFNQAGWSHNSKCFVKFYNREIVEKDSNFVNVVLS